MKTANQAAAKIWTNLANDVPNQIKASSQVIIQNGLEEYAAIKSQAFAEWTNINSWKYYVKDELWVNQYTQKQRTSDQLYKEFEKNK